MQGTERGYEPGLPDRNVRQRLFESALGATSNGVVITDAAAGILYVNAAFTRITGYAREHAIGNNMRMLHSERQDDDFYRVMWQSLLTDGRWEGAIWNRRRDGSSYRQWLTIDAVRGAGGETAYYVGVFADVSTLHGREALLQRHAFVDPLTGVVNRLLFDELVRQALAGALRRQEGLALFSLDLDDFRGVNVRLGARGGDRILQSVAGRLRAQVRAMDVVARIAGDKFALLLAGVADIAAARMLGGKLLRALEQPLDTTAGVLAVSASVGFALYPVDGDDGALLRAHAEAAMEHAKEQGGARVYGYGELHDSE